VRSAEWPFVRWREARFTRDIDLALLIGFGNENDYISPLLEAGYTGRVADAAGFARRHRVLLLTAPNGIPLDIALAPLPFEAVAIDRATRPGHRISRTWSPLLRDMANRSTGHTYSIVSGLLRKRKTNPQS